MVEQNSPEERTASLFVKDYRELERIFSDRMTIVNPVTNRMIAVTKAKGFPTKDNSTRGYKPLLTMPAGEILVLNVQGRNPITLVSALEDGQPGACLKLEQAVAIRDDRTFGMTRRVSDLSWILGVQPNELPRSRLSYTNDEAILHVIRSTIETPTIDQAVADKIWDELMSGKR